MNVVWNSLLRFMITDELKFHEFVSITCPSCTYKYWNLVKETFKCIFSYLSIDRGNNRNNLL